MFYLVNAIISSLKITRLPSSHVLYSTSDYIADVLPSSVFKLKTLGRGRWVAVVHHLIPSPLNRRGFFLKNLLAYFSQRASLLLVRICANKVVCVSDPSSEELIKMGFNNHLVTINYNGVDTKYFEEVVPSGSSFSCVYMARIHPSKGIFELVDIWQLVCSEIADATLAVIGTGDLVYVSKLKEEIKRNGLENNMKLLGYVKSNSEAFSKVKSSRAFVQPSFEEGFGLTVCEALACGVPVVAWDLPVFRQLFPKGLIRVPEKNVKSFSREILHLLRDESYRQDLSLQAKETARGYDWDQIAEKELDVINNL